MSLSSKAILVTGSASGLGLTIAKSLLARGALVTICDVNPSRLTAAKADLSATYSPSHLLALEADVADEDSVKNLVEQSVARFGRLDIVVNNAGIMDKFDPAGDCDRNMWDSILAVNLTGAFLVTKYALPYLLQAPQPPSGRLIVNIGSVASLSGLTAGVAYTASKHGLVALAKHTAGFYGAKGVYSVALMPGGMNETNISDAFAAGMNVEGFKAVKEAHPKMNNVPVDHVARYVAFLCEDGIGQSANGSCIPLTGNWPEA
ncbi:NAD(P)-binding protein [Trichoderma citrinoviride]|uniref:NAD(P)-binding protein n=1 Tax=Trichoderma citrinoviride TaxID=58853 RepID=A0A2T4B002_9HYPO|nr:NAD(P)-binding protein [Trichoderma citrinoviride]PTB62654.1 NAD(P)-binding protein [Trichoderma citrinoviride]